MFSRGQYLFKAQVPDPPTNAFFRRLYPRIIEDLEVSCIVKGTVTILRALFANEFFVLKGGFHRHAHAQPAVLRSAIFELHDNPLKSTAKFGLLLSFSIYVNSFSYYLIYYILKGAQSRLNGLKSLAKLFNFVVLQSVSIFSTLNHPCSFMLCYNLFGVFLSL